MWGSANPFIGWSIHRLSLSFMFLSFQSYRADPTEPGWPLRQWVIASIGIQIILYSFTILKFALSWRSASSPISMSLIDRYLLRKESAIFIDKKNSHCSHWYPSLLSVAQGIACWAIWGIFLGECLVVFEKYHLLHMTRVLASLVDTIQLYRVVTLLTFGKLSTYQHRQFGR